MDSLRILTLKRITSNFEAVTGVLILEQEPIAVTLERPWIGNNPNVSCIPAGFYLCEKYNSRRYKETYIVTKVPTRTHILLHVGNQTKDSTGCILVGTYFGKLNSRMAILNSRVAFKKFMKKMNNDKEFYFRILDV